MNPNRDRKRAASGADRQGMEGDVHGPLAYLITFRTCGSWLHGDPRGLVDQLGSETTLAAALLDIEPRLQKVDGYRHLAELKRALKTAIQGKQKRVA